MNLKKEIYLRVNETNSVGLSIIYNTDKLKLITL